MHKEMHACVWGFRAAHVSVSCTGCVIISFTSLCLVPSGTEPTGKPLELFLSTADHHWTDRCSKCYHG